MRQNARTRALKAAKEGNINNLQTNLSRVGPSFSKADMLNIMQSGIENSSVEIFNLGLEFQVSFSEASMNELLKSAVKHRQPKIIKILFQNGANPRKMVAKGLFRDARDMGAHDAAQIIGEHCGLT